MKNSYDERIVDHEKQFCAQVRDGAWGLCPFHKEKSYWCDVRNLKAVTWQTNEIQASIIEYWINTKLVVYAPASNDYITKNWGLGQHPNVCLCLKLVHKQQPNAMILSLITLQPPVTMIEATWQPVQQHPGWSNGKSNFDGESTSVGFVWQP